MQVAADLVIEHTQDVLMESAYRTFETFAVGPFSVAISLGGTKVAVAIVDRSGHVHMTSQPVEWRTAFGVDHASTEGADRLVAGIVDLIEEALRRVPLTQVATIGISTKGPIEKREGQTILGPGKKIATLPFCEYPLTTRIREMLMGRYGWKYGREPLSQLSIRAQHDGAAAILGEVSIGGTLAGYRDAVAVIIGTGVGLGIIEAGRLYEGLKHNEGNTTDDAANVRVLGSLGRHLVYIVDPDALDGYRYAYRGVPLMRSEAELYPGETYLTERIAGPWLAQRIANVLVARLHAEPLDTAMTLDIMGLTQEDLYHFMETGDKILETQVLYGLTLAGRQGDRWACAQIAALGTEVGRALAEFIRMFQDRAFVRHILLVSSVSEKLGIGVGSQTSDDLFLEHLRSQVEAALCDKGSRRQHARELAAGIQRSQIDFRREFLAFVPQAEETA